MRSLPAFRLSAALLLVATAWSCTPGGGPPTAPTPYEDAVTDRSLTRSSRLAVERGQRLCAEQTHFAIDLRGGETLSARLRARQGAVLEVSGCVPDDQATRAGAGLEIIEEVGGRAVARHLLPLDRAGWWSEEIPTAASGAEHVVLRVRTDPRRGPAVYLRDLHLRAPVEAADGPPEAPRILLVSVDTLRADTIGALGGEWPTPNLDRLVGESQVWTRHRAADSWTKPSHAGLLTGFHPDTTRCIGLRAPIHPAVPTLAERLRDRGLRTAGLVHSCEWLDPEYGFDAGFDEYRVVAWYLRQMVRESVNWMAAHADEPFFYFLHTYDVHSDFHLLPYEGLGATQAEVERIFGVPGYGCTGGHCASIRLSDINKGVLEPLPGEGEILRHLYGCGVRSLDRDLGVLFDELRRTGLLDHMLVVVTSDHGESFLEHGRVLHGSFWDEVLRAPLIIRWPDGRAAGTLRSERVTAYDVAPTLLDHVGVPSHDLPGVVLGVDDVPERTLYLGTAARVVIHGRWKAIFHSNGDEVLLYDLERDPDELHDLATDRPGVVQRLRSLLEAQRREDRQRFERLRDPGDETREAPEISDEERERLRRLGYL